MCLLGPIIISLFAISAINITDTNKRYNVLIVDSQGISGNWSQKSRWCNFEMGANLTDQEFENSKYDALVTMNEKVVTNNTMEITYKEYPNAHARADIIHEAELKLEGLRLEVNNIKKESYYKMKQRLNVKDYVLGQEISFFDKNKSKVGLVFAILIFIFIFNFGIQVMRGVIEEKSNRIVEILVSSVKPIQLMTGKIVGIGLAAISQFMIWTILTALIMVSVKDKVYEDIYAPEAQQAKTASSYNGQDQSIEDEEVTLAKEVNDTAMMIYEELSYSGWLMYFGFFMIFGYLFYAGIYASIGAAVDNDTDVQQFLIPVTLPLILGLIAAYSSMTDPNGAIAYWGSIIPFTSPIVMMARFPEIAGTESGWQIYLSMGILAVSSLFMFFFASKIYKTGILMYGKKASLKELWRWLFKGA
jgi:ABC-2 type transport system permease protein